VDTMTYTARVASVCQRVGGLRPHSDVTEIQWKAYWENFLGGACVAPVTPVRFCKECDSEMVERDGKYGSFWGCTGYPQCKYTEQA